MKRSDVVNPASLNPRKVGENERGKYVRKSDHLGVVAH